MDFRVSAWEELAEALKLGAIVELNLAGNDIGPEGTKAPLRMDGLRGIGRVKTKTGMGC